jgi:adenylate cyclase
MRGIVQYEVYVLEGGRWSLHARYPGVQRADAVNDATATESFTGRPTKVVRDTYFPDLNQNEEVTTYMSPRAKMMKALADATSRRLRKTPEARPRPGASAPGPAATGGRTPATRRTGSKVQSTARLFVAIGVSLFVATSITSVFSWLLSRLAEPLSLQPGTITILLGTAYLGLFMYAFRKAYRARLWLYELLAKMWAEGPPKSKPVSPPPRRVHARPSRDGRIWDRRTQVRPEDAVAPPPVAAAPPEVAPEPVTVAPPPPPPAPPVQAPPAKAPPAASEQKPTAPPKETAPAVPAMVATTLKKPEGLTLERIILRRFAVDVVVPAVVKTQRDDPVTRRGVALLLAGAVRGLGETAVISTESALALLAEALRETGTPLHAIESFVADYETHVAAPTAQPLLKAGRDAISAYVDGGRNIERLLQDALALWRFPSLARVTPVSPTLYVFTRARAEDQEAVRPSTAELLHSAIVRTVLRETDGEEIALDQMGVLARFPALPQALVATQLIQSRMAAAAGPPTMTVLVAAPVVPGSDDVNGLLTRAQTIMDLAGDGDTLCESRLALPADSDVMLEALPDHGDIARLIPKPPPTDHSDATAVA